MIFVLSTYMHDQTLVLYIGVVVMRKNRRLWQWPGVVHAATTGGAVEDSVNPQQACCGALKNSVPKNTKDWCKNTKTIICLRLGDYRGTVYLDFVSANIPQ
jgi:hypothetical protein